MNEKMETMSKKLTEQSDELKVELMELEKQFNIKKEQFIKIQGALEAIQFMGEEALEPEPES